MSPRSWVEELADRNARRREREREQMEETFKRRIRRIDAVFGKIRSELERATTKARRQPAIPASVRALGITRWPCSRADVKRAFEAILLAKHSDRGGTCAFDADALKHTRDAAYAAVAAAAAARDAELEDFVEWIARRRR